MLDEFLNVLLFRIYVYTSAVAIFLCFRFVELLRLWLDLMFFICIRKFKQKSLTFTDTNDCLLQLFNCFLMLTN